MIDGWTPDRMMSGRGISREFRGSFPYPMPMSDDALDKILRVSGVEVNASSGQATSEIDAIVPADSDASREHAPRDAR